MKYKDLNHRQKVKETYFETQGIIEYLQQTGVELPKEVPAPPEPPATDPEPVESWLVNRKKIKI